MKSFGKILPKYPKPRRQTPLIGLFGTADTSRRYLSISGRLAADRLGRRRAFLILSHSPRGLRCLLLCFFRPARLHRSSLHDGLAEHGLTRNFCRHRRLPSPERRAMGFTLQSILKRVPIVIAPVLAAHDASREIIGGVRAGLLTRSSLQRLLVTGAAFECPR